MTSKQLGIACVLLTLTATACGSSDAPRSADSTANDDGTPTAGDPSSEPAGDGNGDRTPSTDDPTKPAVIRVHYRSEKYKGTVGITGEQAPLDHDEPQPMTSAGDDTWEYPLGVLSAPVHVAPWLDNKKALGPDYVVRPGQTLDVYPHFYETKGSLDIRWSQFHSTIHPCPCGTDRPIEVYLPPTYIENTTAHFPVFYMMDSQIAFGTSTVAQMAFGDMLVDEAIDDAATSGAFPEVIVVGVRSLLKPGLDVNTIMEWRNYELTPTSWAGDPTGQVTAETSGGGTTFLDMLVSELKPLADKELRTKPERENTYISGSSLGGLMSLYAGVWHGDVFGGIVSFSGSAFWDDEKIVQMVEASSAPGAIEKRTSRVYASVGDSEDPNNNEDTLMLPANKRLFEAYKKAGYVEGETLKTEIVKGGKHHGDTWSKLVPIGFAAVLGPGR